MFGYPGELIFTENETAKLKIAGNMQGRRTNRVRISVAMLGKLNDIPATERTMKYKYFF